MAWSDAERAQEARLLAELAQARDLDDRAAAQRVREELVTMHLGLVHTVAHQLRAVPSDDMVQAGMVGLLEAVDEFDPTRGSEFGSFAYDRIRWSMTRLISHDSFSLSVPRRMRSRYATVQRAIRQLSADGVSPVPSEVALAAGLDEADVLEALELDHARIAASLDSAIEGAAMSEQLGGSDAELERFERDRAISEVIALLPPQEQAVVRGIYFEHLQQDEIAAALGVSQAQVSRLHSRAKIRLRPLLHDVAA